VAWRLPIALATWFVALVFMQMLLSFIPGATEHIHLLAASGLTTPATMFLLELPDLMATLATMALMAKIEGRSFADYYLPVKDAFGRRFWLGMPFGFLMLSLLMALIAAAHGFSFGTPVLGVGPAIKFGLLYLAGFLLVGLFEEAAFRGYLQATLEQVTGFWPAAVLLAVLFGVTHLGNTSEARYGAFMAGCFGLFAAFVLRRTRNLWFAIGIHTAWDWGETFFYSTPDSGILATGHFTASTFHGPDWLTGGASGPEASAFYLVVLLVSTAAVHFLFPAKAVQDRV
jgi:membrane protease YdiL (CAAX protease family)